MLRRMEADLRPVDSAAYAYAVAACAKADQPEAGRALLEQLNASKGSTVKDFQRMAKEKLGIEFSDDQTKFKMADLAFWKEKRQGEMVDQVGAV